MTRIKYILLPIVLGLLLSGLLIFFIDPAAVPAIEEPTPTLPINTYSAVYTIAQLEQNPLIRFASFPVMSHTGDEWYHNAKLIYHAGGGIEEQAYTNSVQAIESTLAAGHRIIELDFMYTADNRLICAHDWKSFEAETPMLFQDAMATGVYEKYTPLTAENVISFMQQHRDLRIVLDIKSEDNITVIRDLIRISHNDPTVLDRLIIQLYTPGMKEQVLELYFFPEENFLFTAYVFGAERVKEIMQLCYDERIKVVTVPYGKWSQAIINTFRSKDIYVYEHTVNSITKAQDAVSRGVHGLYTDFLQPEDILPLMQ